MCVCVIPYLTTHPPCPFPCPAAVTTTMLSMVFGKRAGPPPGTNPPYASQYMYGWACTCVNLNSLSLTIPAVSRVQRRSPLPCSRWSSENAPGLLQCIRSGRHPRRRQEICPDFLNVILWMVERVATVPLATAIDHA